MTGQNSLPVPTGVLFRDDLEKTSLEARNGVIQARFVLHVVTTGIDGGKITLDLLLEFQRLAVNQIYRCAGHFRNHKVVIKDQYENVVFEPPDWALVPGLVAEMCDYVNENWQTKTPVHLSAYAMWRLNWIHPFFGGNGRTARAFSYLVLCIGLGLALPAGQKTIPQLIEENRTPYTRALREADAAFKQGRLDLSSMEKLLSDLLATQLVFLHEAATGQNHLEAQPQPQNSN